MHIVFLSKYNVQDDIFLKDLSKNFKYQEPVLLVHDSPYSKPEDTGFLTKRISAHLSESMIANIPVSGHQRNIFQADTLRLDLLNSWWKMSGTIVLNTLMPDGSKWNHNELLLKLKQALPEAEVDVFTRNPLSPLGSSGARIQDPKQIQTWMEVYPEEREVLELSLEILPVRILIPKQYTQNA
jgi:hypothetical protein